MGGTSRIRGPGYSRAHDERRIVELDEHPAPAVGGLSGARVRAPTRPGTPENPLLTVEGTTVRYNGQLLPWEDIGGWRRVLGPPSRERDGLLTWDELGLFLYDQDPSTPGPSPSRCG